MGREVDQRVELSAIKGAFLASALDLDETALAAHYDIHVHLGPDVEIVIEIQPQFTIDHTDADRRDAAPNGGFLDVSLVDKPGERIADSDARASDRRGPCTAIGLQHVA